MRNLIIIILVVIVLALGAYFLLRGSSDQNESSTQTVTTSPSTSSAQQSSDQQGQTAVDITFDGNGFSPSSATVKSGGQLTWINNSSVDIEIGANPHPLHTGSREVSGGEFVLKLAPGEKKTIALTKTGTFGYHNHKSSSQGGSVTVE